MGWQLWHYDSYFGCGRIEIDDRDEGLYGMQDFRLEALGTVRGFSCYAMVFSYYIIIWTSRARYSNFDREFTYER